MCCDPVGLTRGVGAAPALGQTQRVAPPGGRGLVVGEARRRAAGGGATAGPLGDLPQLVRQGALALRDGPLGPGGLHFREFTFTEGEEKERRVLRHSHDIQSSVTDDNFLISEEYYNFSSHDCSFTPLSSVRVPNLARRQN